MRVGSVKAYASMADGLGELAALRDQCVLTHADSDVQMAILLGENAHGDSSTF